MKTVNTTSGKLSIQKEVISSLNAAATSNGHNNGAKSGVEPPTSSAICMTILATM